MKKFIWILAALALLLLFPGLGTAIAAVVAWVAGQPVLLGFGLGLAAMPRLRRTQLHVKHA